MERCVTELTDSNGERIVLINDVRFKGKREEWKKVEDYLKDYIGYHYEVEKTSDTIFIPPDFPDEFANSKYRIRLKGAVAKAKANMTQAVPELIKLASNKRFSENKKKKHSEDAKYGWYRYDVRFAIPVYNDKTGIIERNNVYSAIMLVRHSKDEQMCLYDFLEIKKETSSPL